MRRAVVIVGLFFCFLFAAAAAEQAKSNLPRFRPALLGTGPKSLINRIDTAGLIKAGQKDGAVLFSAMALADGSLVKPRTFHAMPDTAALEKEVAKQLEQTTVAPAIYNHQPVTVLFYGTVVFSIVDGGKPQLRIYLHQDPEELKKASDFIGPQPVVGGDSQFKGMSVPQEAQELPVSGVVDVAVKVDSNGVPSAIGVANEDPPLVGFGNAALSDLDGAKFIPAFRDGDPAECETLVPMSYPVD